MTPDLDNLLACYLSGQMPESEWVEWCREYPKLRKMLHTQDKFAKVRALAAQGLPVASKDVREVLAAYDALQKDYQHACDDLKAEIWRLKGGEFAS